NNKDAHTDGKEHDDDIQKSVSPDIHSSSYSDQTRKQGDKAENKDKGKSHVVTITRFRDLNEEFAECINNSSNEVNDAGSSIFAVELNYTNSTNDFSAAGPSNAAMPNLEDLSHNADNVGAEADINNMESIISVSPIPTTRIYKDHPTSQIIGDLSSTTQTRSMPRAVRDQSGISQMFNEDFHTCICGDQAKEQGNKAANKDKGKSPVVTITGFRDLNKEFAECINNSSNGVSAAGPSVSAMFNEDFHTCMFACFLSQEEPKRIHQALKDPS
nr:hypothetical protein [Tanacetum cinerariifolium]